MIIVSIISGDHDAIIYNVFEVRLLLIYFYFYLYKIFNFNIVIFYFRNFVYILFVILFKSFY